MRHHNTLISSFVSIGVFVALPTFASTIVVVVDDYLRLPFVPQLEPPMISTPLVLMEAAEGT